jgi:hypothetical protein
MPSVSKDVARSLIKYVKKIHIEGNILDMTSLSAFEFARQMNSRHLKKSNPKYEWSFDPSPKIGGYLKAEFVNGEIWETETKGFSCSQLRDELFTIAEKIEYALDKTGENPYADAEEEIPKKGAKKK